MGCVYVIGMKETSWVKIGYTSGHAQRRLKDLQTGIPYQLVVLKTYPCERPRRVEREMHLLLKIKKVSRQGEWFDVDITTLDALFHNATLCERTRGIWKS